MPSKLRLIYQDAREPNDQFWLQGSRAVGYLTETWPRYMRETGTPLHARLYNLVNRDQEFLRERVRGLGIHIFLWRELARLRANKSSYIANLSALYQRALGAWRRNPQATDRILATELGTGGLGQYTPTTDTIDQTFWQQYIRWAVADNIVPAEPLQPHGAAPDLADRFLYIPFTTNNQY